MILDSSLKKEALGNSDIHLDRYYLIWTDHPSNQSREDTQASYENCLDLSQLIVIGCCFENEQGTCSEQIPQRGFTKFNQYLFSLLKKSYMLLRLLKIIKFAHLLISY